MKRPHFYPEIRMSDNTWDQVIGILANSNRAGLKLAERIEKDLHPQRTRHDERERQRAEAQAAADACTGDPCICQNGIGCARVPVAKW